MEKLKGDRLGTFLAAWIGRHPGWAYADQFGARLRRPDEIATDLVNEIGFAEVGLASWLSSPDGRLIRVVATQMLPPWQKVELELLIQALHAAADAQHRNDRGRVVGMTAVAGVMLFLIAATAWTTRASLR
jgi:hypothetical protein